MGASDTVGGVSGLVEVRMGGPTSASIGSFAIANMGGWQSWRSVSGNVWAVTGVQTAYLTFTSGQPNEFVDVNWFTSVPDAADR
ncbi:carbohydrate binding protein with CBM6 domain [Micromonospora sp. Llam0]|nr:carbohydrate binding protein with CBM6 domain [Micromonospora sp. Llam0]